MKKAIILLSFVILGSMTLSAQAPPHPPSSADNGGTNGPVGGTGAPVDGGTGILLLLAAAYGIRKVMGQKSKLSI
jgi:hypothetical protein